MCVYVCVSICVCVYVFVFVSGRVMISKLGMLVQAYNLFSTFERQIQENCKFKVTCGYLASVRPVWTIWDLALKQINTNNLFLGAFWFHGAAVTKKPHTNTGTRDNTFTFGFGGKETLHTWMKCVVLWYTHRIYTYKHAHNLQSCNQSSIAFEKTLVE